MATLVPRSASALRQAPAPAVWCALVARSTHGTGRRPSTLVATCGLAFKMPRGVWTTSSSKGSRTQSRRSRSRAARLAATTPPIAPTPTTAMAVIRRPASHEADLNAQRAPEQLEVGPVGRHPGRPMAFSGQCDESVVLEIASFARVYLEEAELR